MEFDPTALPLNGMYKLLISSVVPRPIAWVSSVDADGVRNLAPFSYFMAITDDPPCATSRPRASSSSTWWTTRWPRR